MEQSSDVVVVARKGYQVLLNVGPQTLDIDCYVPINLSHMFSDSQLENCASLRAHLEDGNLVSFTGQSLPKDPRVVAIPKLQEATATKIETLYSQKPVIARTQFSTDSDVDDEMCEDIQKRVIQGREEILDADKQLLKSRENVNIVESSSLSEQSRVVKTEAPQMKVYMDVAPDTFVKKQHASHQRLVDQEVADDKRLNQEIAEIKNNE